MTVLVPFDGSTLSTAALERGAKLADAFETDLRVVTVIPNGNVKYARERGWLAEGEAFDPKQIVNSISKTVDEVSLNAVFDYEVVSRYAQPGTVASKIRNHAKDVGADIVVLGSDNAGSIVTNVSSVAGSVASASFYDVYIVRHRRS